MLAVLKRIMAVGVALAMSGAPVLSAAAPPAEAEASMSFESASVEPFLLRVANMVEGFKADDVKALAREIGKLSVDSTLSRSYPVTFRGEHVNLRVEAFMDDVDAPDLYFFASPALARQIDTELKKFASAQGW
jgi:hypothetical protein